MALTDKSLFLYGFSIDTTNQNLPFRAVIAGPQLNAVIPPNIYTLTGLAAAIGTAMGIADPAHIYTVSIDRTFSSNTQNRITIATSGTHLDLLFATGTTAATSVRDVISFAHSDFTGATFYQNTATSGTSLITTWFGNNYQGPLTYRKNMGNVSVSANGTKEGISWSIQQFIQVEYKYEVQANVYAFWQPLIDWMIKTRPFEYTPEIKTPATTYQVTLEKTSYDAAGLGQIMKEMLPNFPFRYTTGPIEFRLLPS